MTPKRYLYMLGIVLVAAGALGFAGIIGPRPEDSYFGRSWFFNNVENIGHAAVGLVSLAAAAFAPNGTRRTFSLVGAVAGVSAGLYSMLVGPLILGAHFEHPADTIFHLVIGLGGALAFMMKPYVANIPESGPARQWLRQL